MKTVSTAVVLAAAAVSLTGCATESSRSLEVAKVASYNTQYHGVRTPISVFGRRDVGDHQLFGIFGRGKSQIAYAKVALNIVNVNTSEIVYSAQGAGEYALSNREIIGFGGTSGYDATLNGKVLDLAIREAVNSLVQAVDNGAWQPNR
ncbi:TPA: hypothetical protein WIZ78_000090 [Neisseria meningitidis]